MWTYTAIRPKRNKDSPLFILKEMTPIEQIKEKLIRFIRRLLNIVQQSLFSRLLVHKNVTPKVQDRSAVILNPLDTTGFPTHDFTSEKKEIVTVGRLEPQKPENTY